jgi:hypothetical protein
MDETKAKLYSLAFFDVQNWPDCPRKIKNRGLFLKHLWNLVLSIISIGNELKI